MIWTEKKKTIVENAVFLFKLIENHGFCIIDNRFDKNQYSCDNYCKKYNCPINKELEKKDNCNLTEVLDIANKLLKVYSDEENF